MIDYSRELEHVEILIQQKNFTLAEFKLAILLQTNPDDGVALQYLAITKMALEKWTEARGLLQMLMGRYPDQPYAFFLQSRLELANEQYPAAHKAIDEAIRMDPQDADFFATKAQIWLAQSEYKMALDCANRGLALDPQNIECLNIRSMGLVKAGNKEAARLTIDKALEEDPNNATTHANYGWSYLHQGQHLKAMEHYKKALQIDPMNDWAKSGMRESMKARFWPYRMLLQLMLKLEGMPKKTKWGVLIAAYILLQVIKRVANANEALRPLLMPIIAVIVLMFLSTWILGSLMNLYLLANPYGRMTLDEEDKKSAKLVGISLSVALICLVLYLVLGDSRFSMMGIMSAILMIPFGSMYNPSSTDGKKKLVRFSMVLAAIAAIGGLMMLLGFTQVRMGFFIAFILGTVAYQWFANYVIINK